MRCRHALYTVALLPFAACTSDVSPISTPNIAPTVAIVAPAEGSVFAESDAIEFVATTADGNGLDDIQSVVWSSDLEGELGTSEIDERGGIRFPTPLGAGTHLVTVRVTDFDGEWGTDTVTVHAIGESQAPTCLILRPGDNNLHLSDVPLALEGRVMDLQQTPDTLTVTWTRVPSGGVAETLIVEAQPDEFGNVVSEWSLPAIGAWTIRLEATDGEGNSCSDEVSVIIADPMQADLDGDGYPGAFDCDDHDFNVNPGRNELCNGRDDNCSGQIDDKDRDRDGHVDVSCTAYIGPLPVDDCLDTNVFVYEGALELADNADNDCDGQVDEGTALYDDDGDCFCEHLSICNGSINPVCRTLWGDDCDDGDPAMNQADADFDSATTCDGDCDDHNSELNLRDWDRDRFTTCDGDCNDFDASQTPLTCNP